MTASDPGKGVTYTRVKTDELHFDPSNPRFVPPSGRRTTEPQIQSILEKEPHIALELVDSFLENGFIDYEPLVVRRRPEGGYLVVEGNRRLAAIRHILANRMKYAKKSARIDSLDQIPVLIFPEATPDDNQAQQRIYLGVHHLFGFRDWPADSKARFLDAQIHSVDDLRRTMRELNIKKHEIARYLVPFRLRKQAKDIWEPHKDQDFWVLGEGLNRSGIKEYISLDVDKDSLEINGFSKDKLKSLLVFIYGSPEKDRRDRRIEETRDLSKLAKVLASKDARSALEKGRALDDALVLIDTPRESVARLRRLLSELKVVVGVLKHQTGHAGAGLSARFESFARLARELIRNAKKPGF